MPSVESAVHSDQEEPFEIVVCILRCAVPSSAPSEVDVSAHDAGPGEVNDQERQFCETNSANYCDVCDLHFSVRGEESVERPAFR